MTPLTELRALLRPLLRRVQLLAGRVRILVVDDEPGVQRLQVSGLRRETHDRVERVQEYGFTSVPLAGGQALAIFIGGMRDHGVVVATDDARYRPKDLEPGEVALYDHAGQIVRLRADGTVHVKATALVELEAPLVRLKAPNVTCTGNLFVAGSIQAGIDVQAAVQVADAGGTLSTLRGAYNAHTHPENDFGGPTGPPNTTTGE